MRTGGISATKQRRVYSRLAVLGVVLATAMVVGVVAVPSVRAADVDIVIGEFRMDNSPTGSLLATVTSSDPTWRAETITVTLKYSGPRARCAPPVYDLAGNVVSTNFVDLGPSGVSMMWMPFRSGAPTVSYSPGGGTGPYDTRAAASDSGATWSEPRENMYTGDDMIELAIAEGSFSTTFSRPDLRSSAPAISLAAVVSCDLEERRRNLNLRLLPATPDLPPVIEAAVGIADEGDRFAFSFDVSATDDRGSNLSYEWEFGDGSTSDERAPVHRYERPGTYTVTVWVTDEAGNRTSRTFDLVVDDDALVVNSTGDAPAEDAERGCRTGRDVVVGADAQPECTLRAAIQAATADGGGEIAFDIAEAPVIALGSALPTVGDGIVINGSTQTGGVVEVIGGGATVLELAAGAASITGLALHGAPTAVTVSGGSGHRIEASGLGVDRTQSAAEDTENGVLLVGGTGTQIVGNTMSTEYVGVLAGEVDGTVIRDNSIGVTREGALLSAPQLAVLSLGGDIRTTGNTMIGTDFGVMLLGTTAAGSVIEDNEVGTAGGSPVPGAGTGIVVEGAPDVVVRANTVVADEWGGILVAGSVQAVRADDRLDFLSPTGDVLDGPATATDVTVADNVVTATPTGRGLGSWADASGVTFTNNTVSGEAAVGIDLQGGADHRLEGNTVGSEDAVMRGRGVWLRDVSAAAVEGNVVFSEAEGVYVGGEGDGVNISENAITGRVGSAASGVYVSERSAIVVTANTVVNTGGSGVEVEGPAARVAENTVVGTGNGIVIGGADVVVEGNTVGAQPAGLDRPEGTRGSGIVVESGSAVVARNVVVAAAASGIAVAPDATATLRANRVWGASGSAIVSPAEPPRLDAAIISDTESSQRTTLLVTGVPPSGEGTIEVFANDSCTNGEGQAKYVLDIVRTLKAEQTSRVIQFESGRDNFTVTYTDAEGATSALSVCESRENHGDGDGDGSVDPLDALASSEGDPSRAVVATAGEQLLMVDLRDVDPLTPGRLENVRVVDDPAPGTHPDAWSLPYGALSFRVADIPRGGSAAVSLTTVYDEPLLGTSYWKYGPAAPGAAPTWFPFDYDDVSATGATVETTDVRGLGLRRVFTLFLADGRRGDSDGAANGTITDPGGPVLGAGAATMAPAVSEPVARGGTPSTASALADTGGGGLSGGEFAGTILILAGVVLLRRARRSGRGADGSGSAARGA